MQTNISSEQRQQQISELVAAIQAKEPAERAPWLHQQCGDDLELFRAVLVRMCGAAAPGMDTPVGFSTGEWTPTPEAAFLSIPLVGQEVGGSYACHILKEHAKGGMGEVFVAEDKHLGRTVAFKRLQARHCESEESRRRFLTEAQITARLQHPGIVPIYGVTTDADGTPSYLMRFIEGESLADALQKYHALPAAQDTQRRLAFRELLTRFIAVCHTMAYAHAQGIIHRDLKPANIMLGKYGETLVVDWGLAKQLPRHDANQIPSAASVPAVTADTVENLNGPTITPEHAATPPDMSSPQGQTQPGQVMGTPVYMSPEQARGDLDQLGPATDIYSLGATLFVLLTGQPPLKGSVLEILQATIAGRVPGPHSVRADVPKALDAVCRKAMAKEPAQRYPTATDLAREIEHYLADEQVTAYAEPWTVKTRRWMRKHRTVTSSAIVAVIAIVLILSITTGLLEAARQQEARDKWATEQQRQLAEKNAEDALNAESVAKKKEAEAHDSLDRTKKIKNFFEDHILVAARPIGKEGGKGQDISLRTALLDAIPKIAPTFQGQPLLESDVCHVLAHSLTRLGEYSQALTLSERATQLRRQHQGPNHLSTLVALHNVAYIQNLLGLLPQAEAAYRTALEGRKAQLGLDHPDTLSTQAGLAEVLHGLGKYPEVETLCRSALAVGQDRLAPDDPIILALQNGLAKSLADQGKYQEAERLFRKLLSVWRNKVGEDHPDILPAVSGLAYVLLYLGKFGEAEKYYRQNLKLSKIKLGADHPDTLSAQCALAYTLYLLGRYQEAEKLYRITFVAMKKKFAPDDPIFLSAQHNFGLLLTRQGKYSEAETLLQAVLEGLKKKLGPTHPNTIGTQHALAGVFFHQKKYHEAELLCRANLDANINQLGQNHPHTLITQNSLAQLLRLQGKFHEAEALHRATFEATRGQLGAEHPETLAAEAGLANVLIDQGKYAQAESIYLAILVVHKKQSGPEHPNTLLTQNNLVNLFVRAKKFAEAERLALETVQTLEKIKGKELPLYTTVIENLINLYDSWGKPEKGAEWRKRLPSPPKQTPVKPTSPGKSS